MSRYLAFVFLALSASVLAAPAEHARQVPPTPSPPDVVMPVDPPVDMPAGIPAVSSPLGSRSLNTPYKRDSVYPTSTEDCRLSGDSATRSYTHEGQEYSEHCLSRLAFSVPPENRQSCRTTEANAHSYDQDCLFEKAFDEDWRFDLEKVKQEEVAYRSTHPSGKASPSWSALFPTAIADCLVDISVGISEATSIGPNGEILADECLVLLALAVGLDIDAETCALIDITLLPAVSVDIDLDLDLDLAALLGLSATDPITVTVGGIITALGSGCLLQVIASIIVKLGIGAIIATNPLDIIAEVDLAALLALLL